MAEETLQTEASPKRQRLSVEQRIARLDQQKARLMAQAQKSSRQLDTRRKVIVGATILKAMAADPDLQVRVSALLGTEVNRPADRQAIAPWLSPTSIPQ